MVPLSEPKPPSADPSRPPAGDGATVRDVSRAAAIKHGYTAGARTLASRSILGLARTRVTPNALTAAGVALCGTASVLGLRGDVGIGSRAERVAVITAGLVLAPWGVLPWAIALLAVTAWVTVAQRVLYVRKQLLGGSS